VTRSPAVQIRCRLDRKSRPAVHARWNDFGLDDLPIQVATTALSRIYGDKTVTASIQSDGIHMTRWSLDEMSFGAYSVPEPAYRDKHEEVHRPIGAGADGKGPKRLFFAGEGTARDSCRDACRHVRATLKNAEK